ncbi:hypothetical protein QW131_30270 [Roseibium salinum]|nr:hypothetical protein [Roseibium salinum]
MIEAAIVRPFNGLAQAAARFDDTAIDAGPRGIARAAGLASNGLRRADGWAIESAVRHSAAHLSAWLAYADERIVDRCVGLLAAATGEICRAGDGIGEFLTDGLPEGTAQLVGLGGEDARRLQSGLSHHYYTLMAAGTLVTVLLLLMV